MPARRCSVESYEVSDTWYGYVRKELAWIVYNSA